MVVVCQVDYIYIYVHIYIHICMCIYIYNMDRDRETYYLIISHWNPTKLSHSWMNPPKNIDHPGRSGVSRCAIHKPSLMLPMSFRSSIGFGVAHEPWGYRVFFRIWSTYKPICFPCCMCPESFCQVPNVISLFHLNLDKSFSACEWYHMWYRPIFTDRPNCDPAQ